MKKIRVGLIRCDTHGLWYGPLMAEHDPMVLQRPMLPVKHPQPTDSPAKQLAFYENQGYYYSWQSGGVHMYFYNRYGYPLEMTVPFVGGFEIVKLWDKYRVAAEQAARVFFGRPKVCDTFEEVSDDVDLVFVANCNNDGSDHLELARPGLEKGVPTFVDKPFANTVANCRRILELGRKHKAPVFSLSILRAEPALTRLRNRIPEVGEVNFATFQGCGTHPAGLVHTISATQHLFGPGIKTVHALRARNHTSIHLDYGDRPDRPRHGVMINCDVGKRPHTALSASVHGTKDDIHTLILGDYQYPHGTAEIIKMIKQMVCTRKSPPLMDEVLESIAVIEACRKAERSGKRTQVRSIS
jgi:predicted dehydrogenase